MDYLLLLLAMLPAMIANMMPVVAAKLRIFPSLAFPIDRGATFRGKRIFGDHKTFRGFVIGIAAGVISVLILFYLPLELGWSSLSTAVLWGFLISTGALIGDAVKSFFKRQLNVASGRPFIPFDQIDYVLGAILLSAPFFAWNIYDVLFLLLFAAVVNPVVNLVSYALGIKTTYY